MQKFTFYNFAKLSGLILGIAVANIVVFSPGLLGLQLRGAGALETALGVTFIVASLLILLSLSYQFLFKPTPPPAVPEIKSRDDLAAALSRFKRVKGLAGDIDLALSQLERIEQKKNTLYDVLQQRFDESEMTFTKFAAVIQSVENLFYRNMKSMLSRLHLFSSAESTKISDSDESSLSKELLHEKENVYHEYLQFVKDSLNTNEEILLRLDKLLLEVSRLDHFDPEEIETMSCIQEIDDLIRQTKLYK
ncbi:hypothetical protein EV586_106165 [Tumebacillus sp. BK434]|uniref:hypothetical protein n=1 Tax=Tumebacillus sp. BK434 TaxID=2512169 RepID=UPI00104C109D|nr:hypothetical protein [Tumebacillus sp. BK434]TCP53416.1 hypothetical protein EV586_106165 [Tumebacillus sp. BK434]